MRDAFISELVKIASEDDRAFLITGDLGFGVLNEYQERFPNQFLNVGVAEQNMTAVAAGMALEGYKVYTYSIGNFPILRGLEHLRNLVCYHSLDVTAVSVGGGFSYGQLGMSHFATEDIAIMRALPNMCVVSPTEAWETAALTRQIHDKTGPTYLRLDKSIGGTDQADVQLGRIRSIRDGRDVVILATGGILKEAVEAASLLETEGISTSVLAVHTVKPFDVDSMIEHDGKLFVTLEEHNKIGGLGGVVSEVIAEQGLSFQGLLRIGLNDEYPTVVGDQNYLRGTHGMTAKTVAKRVVEKLRSA